MTTGEKIKRARKAAGLTQQELGEILGVSGSMIGQYETNLRNPKHETLSKIASALKLKPYELYGEFQMVYHNVDFADKVAKAFGLLSGILGDNDTPPIIKKAIKDTLPNLDEICEELPDLVSLITTMAIFKAFDTPDQSQKQLLALFEALNKQGKTIAIERLLELSEVPRYQHNGKEEPK